MLKKRKICSSFYTIIIVLMSIIFLPGGAQSAEYDLPALNTGYAPAKPKPDRYGWTAFDIGAQLAVNIMIGLDWMQTYEVAGTRTRYGGYAYKETGWAGTFIGKHPSKGRVNTYFAIGFIAHPVISACLPKKTDPVKIFDVTIIPSMPLRTFWQAFWFGVEGNTVYQNYRAGIRLKIW